MSPAGSSSGYEQKVQMRSAFDEDKGQGNEGPKLTAENLEMLGNREKAELEEMKRKLNIHTQQEAQKKLQDIKAERKDLRTKLDLFQKNFEANHNRKIRYTKDILPVQAEFKRYKDLKVDVAKIEKYIKVLPYQK